MVLPTSHCHTHLLQHQPLEPHTPQIKEFLKSKKKIDTKTATKVSIFTPSLQFLHITKSKSLNLHNGTATQPLPHLPAAAPATRTTHPSKKTTKKSKKIKKKMSPCHQNSRKSVNFHPQPPIFAHY
jgi:hypothetical protein